MYTLLLVEFRFYECRHILVYLVFTFTHRVVSKWSDNVQEKGAKDNTNPATVTNWEKTLNDSSTAIIQ